MSKDRNCCEHLKELLVENGMTAVEQARQNDAALAAHLRGCSECLNLLQAWEQIPDLLEQLPEHEPDEELLQKVCEAAAPGRQATGKTGRRFLAPSLASAAVLLAAIGLSRELLMHESPTIQATSPQQRAAGQMLSPPEPDPPSTEFEDGFAYTENLRVSDKAQQAPDDGLDDSMFFGEQKAGQDHREADRLELDGSRARHAEIAAGPESPAEETRKNQPLQKAGRQDLDAAEPLVAGKLDSFEVSDEEGNEPASRDFKKETYGLKSKLARKETSEAEAPVSSISEGLAVGGAFAHAGFNFLAHYQQTDNLHFQPAIGYWANRYVPGDPEIRLLSARLAQWDRSWLDGNTTLEQDIAPPRQPFDAPAENALALSVMADSSAVSTSDDGATRMRLQVGIRGIEHRRGQRPAMNVAVVVDLPADASDDVRIATRALLDAMLESKQAGDRFSLVMTGSGLLVEADDFRFGSLQLAKQQILGEKIAQKDNNMETSELSLHDAVLRASAMVQQTDDPGRPLGSSSVLLISANSLENTGRLAALAHEKAREGITLSVVPLGNQAQNESVEKLVLAGLGNRRFLEAPGKARQLIEEELHASSRAVARAARLSIRLAPGVRLIEVVGSQRLDSQRAQRVREIENSMDRRLSANLGIQADRGEDEDGIQIVIPSIFSGDSVVVLLDVVTDRPGAIADVSLRYKDLVFLRNGSLQSHLELGGGENNRGPAEFTVLKNLLSHHFVEAVEQAAEALGRQQPARALEILREIRATIEQARRDVPAWAKDPDLIRDIRLLDRYIAALASPRAGAHQSFLADSLRYAAWAKTHRPLPEHITRSESK
jgi:hypothetical protein